MVLDRIVKDPGDHFSLYFNGSNLKGPNLPSRKNLFSECFVQVPIRRGVWGA